MSDTPRTVGELIEENEEFDPLPVAIKNRLYELEAERDAIRAELGAIRAQEPVAWGVAVLIDPDDSGLSDLFLDRESANQYLNDLLISEMAANIDSSSLVPLIPQPNAAAPEQLKEGVEPITQPKEGA
jgi:hypothetical protein